MHICGNRGQWVNLGGGGGGLCFNTLPLIEIGDLIGFRYQPIFINNIHAQYIGDADKQVTASILCEIGRNIFGEFLG